jgi:hypothetical protein
LINSNFHSRQAFPLIASVFTYLCLIIITFWFNVSSVFAVGYPELISVTSGGTLGNYSDENFPSVSANGRYVAFGTQSTNLVTENTNGTPNIYIRDRQANTITLISIAQSGTSGGNNESNAAAGEVHI